jgi:hypothetical protein
MNCLASMRPVSVPAAARAAVALLATATWLAGFAAAPAAAQPVEQKAPALLVTFHLHCFSGVPEAARTRLEYWNTGVARGNPDPDCVARKPLLAPVLLLGSAR